MNSAQEVWEQAVTTDTLTEAVAMRTYAYDFGECVFVAEPDNSCPGYPPGYAVISFLDGTTTDARPHYGDEYGEKARFAGYGEYTDPMARSAYTVEHEAAHVFVSKALGKPYSPTQWNQAHNVHWTRYEEELRDEERLVRWWQRYCNGYDDHRGRLQPLLDAGIDLQALKAEWEAVITETFGSTRWWESK